MVLSDKDHSQLLTEFAKKNPEIAVNYTKVQADSAATTQVVLNKKSDLNNLQILVVTDIKDYESKNSGKRLTSRQEAQLISGQERTTLIYQSDLSLDKLEAAILSEKKYLEAQVLPLRLQIASDKAASTWQNTLEVSIDDTLIAKDKYSVEVDANDANAVILQFKDISVYKTYTPKISIQIIK